MRVRWLKYRAEAIDSRVRIIRALPIAGRGIVVALATLNVVLGLLPVLFVIATSVLIGRVPGAVEHGVHSAQWGGLVVAFLVAACAFFAQQLLAPGVSSLGAVMKHRVDGAFRDRLIEVSLRSTGIGALEDQDNLDDLRQASDSLENGFRTPGDAAVGTLAYLARYTAAFGYVVLVGVVASWWAALAIGACTACFRYGHRSGLRLWTRVWPARAPMQRRREYFRRVGTEAPAAKELRIFGLIDWAAENHRDAALAGLQPLWIERRRMVVYRLLWFTGFALIAATGVLALLVRSAAQGHVTVTQLALGLQAAIGALVLGEYYTEADNQAQFGMMAAEALERLEARVDAALAADVSASAHANAGGLPEHEIRFEGVSFSYEGNQRPVLRSLDLTLRAGECTALVGLNGAGKTTLVKLLARLYEPSEGAIFVDGRPLRDFDVDSWRRQLGVIFQDFTRYELSAADNIAFGAIEREHVAAPVRAAAVRAVADRAGIAKAIDALPRGFDTFLARQYDDGAELSGGQWQRVAIARALYAVDGGARVLVMDEPTAALDVRAEAEFFDQFVELTRGVTTLLISHRFSSVRHADRIVVIDGGRVVEEGTHASLLAAGGRYADLFTLQASRFALGLDDEGNPLDVDTSSEMGVTR